MYEARSREEWNHTASVMAATIQPHTRKKINPMQLHPWEKSNFQKGTKLSVSGLAAAFKLKKKT